VQGQEESKQDTPSPDTVGQLVADEVLRIPYSQFAFALMEKLIFVVVKLT
jgi:hypothetical protein